MPYEDGTGPRGEGPLSGRGFGSCRGFRRFGMGFRRAHTFFRRNYNYPVGQHVNNNPTGNLKNEIEFLTEQKLAIENELAEAKKLLKQQEE